MPPQEAYLQPVVGLSYDQLRLFREGEKEFKVPWVVFPLLGGHWGLGPTFIADACSTCHINGGRGRTIDNTIIVQQLLRLSVPGKDPQGRPNPHPNYGDQIQVFGVNVGLKENVRGLMAASTACMTTPCNKQSLVGLDGKRISPRFASKLRPPSLGISV